MYSLVLAWWLWINLQIGFRVEGLEGLIDWLPKLFPSSKSPLDTLSLKSVLSDDHRSKQRFNPRLTLSVRVSGQEVSFIHFDKNTPSQGLIYSTVDNAILVPVKFFQTYVTPMEANWKLQPHGMWMKHERTMSGVIDVDGMVKIDLHGWNTRKPRLVFESTKQLRVDRSSGILQFVYSGFSQHGVASITTLSNVVHEQTWRTSYSPSSLTIQFSHPNSVSHYNTFYILLSSSPRPVSMVTVSVVQDIFTSEMNAFTYTFYTPARLPISTSQLEQASRPVLTSESGRVTYSTLVKAFKSVELEFQVRFSTTSYLSVSNTYFF